LNYKNISVHKHVFLFIFCVDSIHKYNVNKWKKKSKHMKARYLTKGLRTWQYFSTRYMMSAQQMWKDGGYLKLMQLIMSKSSVLLAIPNKAQLACPIGNSQPEKVVPCLQPSATLANLPSSTRQSNWRVPWSSNRTCQRLAKLANGFSDVCFLRKKRHHAGNSLKRDPYRKLVSKRSLYRKICHN